MAGRDLSKVPWFAALAGMLRRGGTKSMTDKDVLKLIAQLEYPLALHLEIYAFIVTAELSASRIALRDKIIAGVDTAVRAWLPDTRLLIHGSHATGLAHHCSDINLIAKKVDDSPVSRVLITQILERSFPQKSIRISTLQRYVRNHHVVQLEDLENQIVLRISVVDDSFLKRVKWVNKALRELPEARPLYMVIKALMTSADYVHPTDGSPVASGGEIMYRSRLSSWLLMCLVVAFCRRCRETRIVRSLLGDLLTAFLHTFTNFKYSEFIIDPNAKTGVSPRLAPLAPLPVHVLDPVTHLSVDHDISGPNELMQLRVYLDALLKMLIDTPALRPRVPQSILAPALSMEVWQTKNGDTPNTYPASEDYAIFRPHGVVKCPGAYR